MTLVLSSCISTKSYFVFLFIDLSLVDAQDQTYLINFNRIWWSAAQTFCECFGTLARLDSPAEMNHFMSTFAKYVNCVIAISVGLSYVNLFLSRYAFLTDLADLEVNLKSLPLQVLII